MLNKTRKLITGLALSLSAAVLLLLFSVTTSFAAVLTPASGGNDVDAADTIDAAAQNGATDANIELDITPL